MVCAVTDTTVSEAHSPVDWDCDFMHKLFTSNLFFFAQLTCSYIRAKLFMEYSESHTEECADVIQHTLFKMGKPAS